MNIDYKLPEQNRLRSQKSYTVSSGFHHSRAVHPAEHSVGDTFNQASIRQCNKCSPEQHLIDHSASCRSE